MSTLRKPVKPTRQQYFLQLDISQFSDFENLYEEIQKLCNIHGLEFSDFTFYQNYEECYYNYSLLEPEESYQKNLEHYKKSLEEYELKKLTFSKDSKIRKVEMCKRAIKNLEDKKVEILKQLEQLENGEV